jgi:hypothetical protein
MLCPLWEVEPSGQPRDCSRLPAVDGGKRSNDRTICGSAERLLSTFQTDDDSANTQEHTILLRPTVKEVVSRGDDY